jgi:hypothetical protein
LLLNEGLAHAASAVLPAWAEGPVELYRVSARALRDTHALLNGHAVSFDRDPFTLEPERFEHVPNGRITLPPASYLFAVFSQAHAPACL